MFDVCEYLCSFVNEYLRSFVNEYLCVTCLCCVQDPPDGDTNYVKAVELRKKRNHYVMVAHGLLDLTLPNTTKEITSGNDSDPEWVPPAAAASAGKQKSKRAEQRAASSELCPSVVVESKPRGASEVKTTVKTWFMCCAPPLHASVETALRAEWDERSSEGAHHHVYVFWHRVAKEFKLLWTQQGKDSLYCNREANVKDAVKTVFDQVPREMDCAYGRDLMVACQDIQPVLEKVFEMPGATKRVGSNEWFKQLGKNPENIPYLQAAKHEELEKLLVRMLIQHGEKGTGKPRLRPGAHNSSF